MKTLMLTSTLALSLSTAAMANDDFESNSVSLVLERDNLTFGVESVDGKTTELSAYLAVLPHTVLGADADVTLGFKHQLEGNEETHLSIAYGLGKTYGQTRVYGDVEAEYLVGSNDQTVDGEWDVTPTVGVAYTFNEQLSAFGEVSYTWEASNDWARAGGAIEVGTRWNVTEIVWLQPSLVHSFDVPGAKDQTNAHLELGLRF